MAVAALAMPSAQQLEGAATVPPTGEAAMAVMVSTNCFAMRSTG